MEFLIQERQICDRIKIQAYIIVEEIFCCFAEEVSREKEKMEHHINCQSRKTYVKNCTLHFAAKFHHCITIYCRHVSYHTNTEIDFQDEFT